MSCDEQIRFESVLRSLGAHDGKKFLQNQSGKEVLHLLFIKEGNITNWKLAIFQLLNARLSAI
jgi:hypothetical protein